MYLRWNFRPCARQQPRTPQPQLFCSLCNGNCNSTRSRCSHGRGGHTPCQNSHHCSCVQLAPAAAWRTFMQRVVLITIFFNQRGYVTNSLAYETCPAGWCADCASASSWTQPDGSRAKLPDKCTAQTQGITLKTRHHDTSQKAAMPPVLHSRPPQSPRLSSARTTRLLHT